MPMHDPLHPWIIIETCFEHRKNIEDSFAKKGIPLKTISPILAGEYPVPLR